MFNKKTILVILSIFCRGVHAEQPFASKDEITTEGKIYSRALSIPDPPTTSATTRSLPAYILPPPICSVDVTGGTSVGDVTCAFTGIVGPNDAIVSMEILSYDCVSNYTSTSFGDTVVTANTSQAIGLSSFDAIAKVDPSSGYAGEVAFCVRTDLKEATSTETMVYRSQRITITFNYDGSFELGFVATPFVGIGQDETYARKDFGVTATVCDSTGITLSNPPALSLGTNLFVCIKTNNVGTNIPSITSFIAKKDAESAYDVNTSSPNVVVRGLNSSNVKVAMNLPARFFTDSTDILLSGSADVAYDSRRRLANSRTLADESKNEFEMVIKVNDNDDGGGSSASGCIMLMSTAIFVVAAMFFI